MSAQSHLVLNEQPLKPGAEWAHTLSCWCIGRLRDGQGYWLQPGKVLELQAGDTLVIPPGAEGVLRVSQLGELSWQFFYWHPDLVVGMLTLPERSFFEKTDPAAKSEVQLIAASEELAGQFAKLTGCAHNASLLARSQLLQLVGSIFAPAINRQPVTASAPFSAAARFKELAGRLTDSELLKLSPAQLAERCGCSLRHFGRLFYQQFGVSVRARQTRLRLQRASLLLLQDQSKVIDVALDSGYRNLALFNRMFKKYMGMTPSHWRREHAKKSRPRRFPRGATLIFLLALLCSSFQPGAGAGAAEPAAKPAEPSFKVTGYQVEGNTVLTTNVIESIFSGYTGDKITLDTVRKALTGLQLAYRERGFVTVHVGLPKQQLTNNIVKVQVVEGRLSNITIANNHHYSSNNIMRALPSLRTNILLNSLVFQQDLDRANANQDRQIYPELGPGPEAGTSSLNLKVKDRFPLHVRAELNNQSTPDTPDLRFNTAVLFNNLWQLDHQLELQYNFTPEACKDTSKHINYFFDWPRVDSYSAYYRMLLGGWGDPGPPPPPSSIETSPSDGGRFRPPPSAGRPELVLYASRCVSDTGSNVQSSSLMPATLGSAGGLQVSDITYNETVTFNEDLGFRVTEPLTIGKVDNQFTGGMDYKAYRSFGEQDRVFQATLYIPEFGSNGPPFLAYPSPPVSQTRNVPTTVNYLPFFLGWSAGYRTARSTTVVSLNDTFNFEALSSSPRRDFQIVAQTPYTSGNFNVVNGGVDYMHKMFGEWELTFKANGQAGSQTLIGNEQFALGGLAGPRGYLEGQEYGDAGWRFQFEPRTPLMNIGRVDGAPTFIQFSVFADYGERYWYSPKYTDLFGNPTPAGDFKPTVRMAGTGLGMTGVIGTHLDFRLAMAFPLLDAGGVSAGQPHFYFGVGAHF